MQESQFCRGVVSMRAFLGALAGIGLGGFIGFFLGLALGDIFVPAGFGAEVALIACGALGAFVGAFFGEALGVYYAMKTERQAHRLDH